MKTKRIISCLDVYKNRVVKGVKFKKLKKFKSPLFLSRKYEKQGIDEIIFLNIKKEKIIKIIPIIKKISKKINIPLIVGGNIRDINEVKMLFNNGADKLTFNSTYYYNNRLIKNIKKIYGKQSIIASVDVKLNNKKWIVYIDGGKKCTKIEIIDWLRYIVGINSGELLITSIDNDGCNNGYDIKLINYLEDNTSTQIIASGGGGNINTIIELFEKTYVNSSLLASCLHSNKLSVSNIKRKLKKNFFIREC